MIYAYDFEFNENGETIEPISVGMVCEDGREYYAQFSECDLLKSNPFVQEHVIPNLKACQPNRGDWMMHTRILGGQCGASDCTWYSTRRIAVALVEFVNGARDDAVEFWGNYAAYDHIALMQLYGPMVHKPLGWPMVTFDIQQLIHLLNIPREHLPQQPDTHNALDDARWNLQAYWHVQELLST